MNKVFKLGSLVLAGAIFVGVGCNKEADKEKQDAMQKSTTQQALQAIGESTKKTAADMGNNAKKAGTDLKDDATKMGTDMKNGATSMMHPTTAPTTAPATPGM